MADAHKNFAYSTVATAPSPAASGTSLVVAAGQGALFPVVPFNATVWPRRSQALSTTAEVVRVTNIATDTLTITRAQESSVARTIVVGDQIAATVTAKTLTDVETTAAAAYTPGGTDVAVADGGTGASTAAAARANLGLTHQILVSWAGTMPSAIGAGVVWIVPLVSGVSETFALTYAKARVEVTPTSGSAQFVLEKSPGTSAFSGSPTTVSTLTIASPNYETADTGVSVSVSSGNLLRLRFATLGGLGGACAYSIELQGAQT